MNGKSFALLFFGLHDSNYPYTRIIHEILRSCADNGAQVSAFCIKQSQTESKENYLDGIIKIEECPNLFSSKGLTYLSYSFFSFFYILKTFFKRPDTCFIVPTTPPFILTLVVSVVKLVTFGKLKWIYHVQDVHPEISFVDKKKTRLYQFLRKLDTLFIQSSNKTITLSKEMKSALLLRDKNLNKKIAVVNNFVEDFSSSNYSFDLIEEDKRKGKVIYIFSGNVGKYQRVVEVVNFFLNLEQFNDVLYILGDGDELVNVEKILCDHKNRKRVRLLGRKPYNEANQIAAQCDYGIVSLNPEITKYAYPSKFATYLSMGLKVLAFIDADSQIAQEINDYQLGMIISEDSLLYCKNLYSERISCEERYRVKGISKKLFGKEKLIRENCQILGCIK